DFLTRTAHSRPHTLSLHDALPISPTTDEAAAAAADAGRPRRHGDDGRARRVAAAPRRVEGGAARPVSRQRGAAGARSRSAARPRSEEHTSELQSRENLVCRLLLEK